MSHTQLSNEEETMSQNNRIPIKKILMSSTVGHIKEKVGPPNYVMLRTSKTLWVYILKYAPEVRKEWV